MGEGSSIPMSCGVGGRHSSDPALLCLWWRPAAIASIRPLDWELAYAACADLKRKEKESRSSYCFPCAPAWEATHWLGQVLKRRGSWEPGGASWKEPFSPD